MKSPMALLPCRMTSDQTPSCKHIRQTCAMVHMVRCNTAVLTEAIAALGTAAGHPLAGLWNSGGILQDAVLRAQTAAHIRAVFAPKLLSAWAMQHATCGQPVQHQLLFSSAASLFGAPGQSNYAAANAALEGWVTASTVSGLNQVAIQWGAWAAGGWFSVFQAFMIFPLLA